jgi:superfamily II DNA or RNA helicase
VIDLFGKRPGRTAKAGQFRRVAVEPEDLPGLLLPHSMARDPKTSVEVITALPTEQPSRRRSKSRAKKGTAGIQRFRLPTPLYEPVLAHLSAAGALGWWDGRRPSGGSPLIWDKGPSWQLVLRLEATASGDMLLVGDLERNSSTVPLSGPQMIVPAGEGKRPLIIFDESIGRLQSANDLRWVELLREAREIVIPGKDLDAAFADLYEIPNLPRVEIPADLGLDETAGAYRPRLVLRRDPVSVLPNAPLVAELSFLYGDQEVSAADPRATIVDRSGNNILRRDLKREHESLVQLLEAGARPQAGGHGEGLELSPEDVPRVAEPLLRGGWEVQFHGDALRMPSPMSLRIESGIDWFEVSGEMDFAGDEVELRRILEAVKKGDRFVELADGSKGLLPASLTETCDSLSSLAQSSSDDGLRFYSSQALLVDALLVDMPAADVDAHFAELREKLRSFESIKPKKEPRGFSGTLRPYQREGLGWLTFLREFGLGGILADDMGLGKTVQVLALLRGQRTPSRTTGLPSLVIVPRSLLYNWIEEASRFTPTLKIVEYGGPGREALQAKIDRYDVVVTTYGTLRRDVAFLSSVEFDTIVLDEAQAIKNRDSQSAKASRLLHARHRLALTGTPIENHLGELGSILEFLNPGLLGRLPVLEALYNARNASAKELEKIAESIRPFILRRTKQQVLPDLPPKTEQVLHCGLTDRQRELYDQLRAGYQVSLLQKFEQQGGGASLEVLEALLRLRQIACHPGLVNEEWADAGSAKLDALFELITEVLDEGHKIIVFSQFTKLLAFVRAQLDELGTVYAYLDGQTRNRGEVVDRFQSDASCNIFLISLKAGGVGLNLTAASYVFLLDPWWNPAVEAQAIDRAHRIGQDHPVFAYRMIAEETVEEKILDLQKSKRQIADAILEGEGTTLADLTAEDLKVLLS